MKEAKFTQIENTFSMVCRVEINIHANADVIWTLLTDAKNFPRWNSTISGIDGQIREGERLRIHVPGTNRTFKPRVLDVVANNSMTWSDGFAPIFKGSRTFVLSPWDDGSINFIMEEHFRGLIFGMVKGMLPDFRPIFESYAGDLKREAERVYVMRT
ncbi:MAG TPA: SRPBCC domain-containing protein [Chitinophagaceae bacterium]|jgi:hypothetical protein